MHNKHLFPLTLLTVAILSGCSTAPKNSSLTEVRISYNEARNSQKVNELAPLELKQAGDSLSKAEAAESKGESPAKVNHLAYIAYQQVRIAQETAFRKTDELAVTNAGFKRDQVRLDARTAEVDEAKKQTDIANKQMEAAQLAANQQSEELAAASANAVRDQALIAKQEMQLNELNAKKTKRGLVITLGDVLFSSNKAQMKSGGERSLQKLAAFLNQYPKHKVLIEGYTDSVGSESLNQELSERRADTVRSALVGIGIGGERIITRGYGKKFPVSGNATAADRQSNRRVEIIISDENGNLISR